MIVVRHAVLPEDAAAIAAIDTTFVTSQVWDVEPTAEGISLRLRDLASPLEKRFPLDDLEDPTRPWDRAWVAIDGERCAGFAAAAFSAWNRRLVLWHLYVDRQRRRRGMARRLLAVVEAHGRACGARHIWLETSSVNVPGVAAYRALGFALTGADLTLYDGTPAEGERALFLSRALDASA